MNPKPATATAAERVGAIGRPVGDPMQNEVNHPHSETIPPLFIENVGENSTPLGSGVITGLIGAGAIGTVYRIRRDDLAVQRAAKVLNPGFPPAVSIELEAELKIPAQLKHPSFVHIYTFGKWEGMPFIEMELIDGPALSHLLAGKKPIPLEVCTAIGILLCESLEYLHRFEYAIESGRFSSLLHLNIKPSNVFLTHDGELKLLDAGRVTALINLADKNKRLPCTARYAAPELYNNKNKSVAEAADLYSVAKLLMDLIFLSGQSAGWPAPVEVDDPASARHLPRLLMSALHTALAEDPQERHLSISEFREHLQRVHRSTTRCLARQAIAHFVQGDDLLRFRRMRASLRHAIAGGVVAAAVAAIGVLLLNSQPVQDPTGPSSPGKPSAAPSMALAGQTASLPDSANAVHATTDSAPALPGASTEKKADENRASPAKSTLSKPSWLESLRIEYNTRDLSLILAGEVSHRHFARALDVGDSLGSEKMRQMPAALYKLRALQGANKTTKLNEYLASAKINDGEFYLAKARHEFAAGRISDALALLERCRAAPARLADKNTIEKDATYGEAECLSAIYKKNPDEKNLQAALDKWFAVKSAFRDNQTHAYFLEANTRIRQLSKERLEADQ